MSSAEQTYLALATSEVAVTAAASRIFAAYLTAYEVEEADEDPLIEKAVRLAIKLAAKADESITSDEELNRENRLAGSSGLPRTPQVPPRGR